MIGTTLLAAGAPLALAATVYLAAVAMQPPQHQEGLAAGTAAADRADAAVTVARDDR